MVTVLLFLLVISALIVIHEMGHFIAARAFGIRVEEFAIGFPPRVRSIVKGETRYSINAIPLGGYVKLTGEEDPGDPRSLASKSIPVRVTVLTAGVFMNLALSIVLFSIFLTFPSEIVDTQVVISVVEPGTPAERSGMLPGDIILRINPQSQIEDLVKIDSLGNLNAPNEWNLYTGHPVDTIGDLTNHIKTNLGSEVTLLISRGATPLIVKLTPRLSFPPNQGPMGIAVGMANGRVVNKFEPSLTVIPKAFQQIYRFTTDLGGAIGNIFTSSEGRDGLTGPIGIAQVTGEIAKTGILPFIGFVGILSLNLAIFNILPIPALDGGRLLFVVIEGIRGGRRVPPQKEALIHLMGFVALIGIIILVSLGDVSRIIRGDRILP